MPTVQRPVRSLLALALVVTLVAASAPAVALAAQRPSDAGSAAPTLPHPADRHERAGEAPTPARPLDGRVANPVRSDWTSRPKPAVPEPRVTAVSRQTASTPRTTTSTLRGRNHVWIPALRIDRSVAGYSCSSSYYPGNRVYRWGCAGTNNVYLFGHAHSVFKPLHDAYVRGRLRKGMTVYYAGSNGRVGTYKVSWWKVTTPTKGTWAYAPLSRPSLTLQTCVGANSRYRLIVRLTKVS